MLDTTRIWFDLKKSLETDVIAEIDEKRRRCRKCIGGDENIQILPYGFGQSTARISAQTSLPKLMNGSNVKPLSLEDTRRALHVFTEGVSKILRLEEPPTLDECHVYRADFVHDWIVDSPEAYLSILERFAVVRGNHNIMVWKNGQDKGTTVKAGSKQQMMMVYNKEAEVAFRSKLGVLQEEESDLAKGRLRGELSIKSKGWIPVLGKNSPTLAEIDDYIVKNGRSYFAGKWDKFTDGWGDSSLESARVQLTMFYGKRRGRQLADMLSSVRSIGVNKYLQVCTPDPATWYRFRRSLREADVALTQSGGLEKLSVLKFDDFESSNRAA